MAHPRQRHVALSMWMAGFIVVLLSFGGSWGAAYGQTAGPTPTPSGTALSVIKTVDDATPLRGTVVTFTIRVQNIGDETARTVVISDPLPTAFEIETATATKGVVAIAAQTVTVTIDELTPGETVLLTITARIRADASGEIRNAVGVTTQTATGVTSAAQEAEAFVTIAAETGAAAPAPAPGDSGNGGIVGGGDAQAEDGTAQQLSATGATPALRWPLLLIGLVLVMCGSLIFVRVRKAS